MRPGETEPISHQIAKLQRTVRWLHVERIIMLAVIGGLLAMGPAAQWWAVAKQPFAAGERGASWAVVRTFAGLRQVFHVQPAIDPTVVLEDEREAFGEPQLGPNPAQPLGGKTLASAVHRTARNFNTVARARFSARLASRSAAQSRHKGLNAARMSTAQPHTAGIATLPTAMSAARIAAVPANAVRMAVIPAHAARTHAVRHELASSKASKSQAATLAAEGARIGRDLEKSLAPLPVNQSFQALAMANLQDAGPLPATSNAVAALPVAPAPILPDAVQPAAAPSATVAQPGATTSPAIAAAPVNLKALGYSQAEDGSAQIVLSNGNALMVVNEGQEFLDRFRVVSLSPEGVDVEDGLTHQTIHLSF